MKIGFDAKRLLFNSTGLGNYSRRWVEALIPQKSIEIELYAPREGKFMSLPVKFPGNTQSKRPASLWRVYGMGKAAENNGCAVFHGLSNEIPFDKPKIPMVCTIHDVIFKEFPHFYGLVDRQIYECKTRNACSRAAAIIVTSQTTKEQLLRFYPVQESRIQVIYQSIEPRFAQTPWCADTLKPYLLYYSSFNPRKNQIKLLQSFAKIAKHSDFDLVLAGQGRGLYEMQEEVLRLKLSDNVRVVVSPNNDEIINLLSKSSGFIYPSLQEGFGIPLVEAAHMGVPMAVSDIPIFRELSGNVAAAYFDPRKLEEMSEAMTTLFKVSQDSTFSKDRYHEIIEKTQDRIMVESALRVYHAL